MSNYWNFSELATDDTINAAIWQQSPSIQLRIHHPNQLIYPGSVGAQQAMCGNIPLPWEPDIVGKKWKDPGGIIIVGSAYAGFIEEYSRRSGTMPLSTYIACSSVPDYSVFQNAFLNSVVSANDSHYGPLESLAKPFVDLSNVALFDLCRVSFVCRGMVHPRRSDKAGDAVVKKACDVFEKYVDSCIIPPWTWKRINEGAARRIIALGTIAEHGLLRLFQRHGFTITDKVSKKRCEMRHRENGSWVSHYADSQRKLGYWVSHNSWWMIEGSVDGTWRQFYLLPVYHPSRYQQADPNYANTKKTLELMIRSS